MCGLNMFPMIICQSPESKAEIWLKLERLQELIHETGQLEPGRKRGRLLGGSPQWVTGRSYTRPGKRLQFANWKMAQSK
jgi:hypothetical protein